MIRAVITATKPDEVEATMSITMTVGEWKELRRQIPDNGYPAWRFTVMIRDLVNKIEAHHEASQEVSG